MQFNDKILLFYIICGRCSEQESEFNSSQNNSLWLLCAFSGSWQVQQLHVLKGQHSDATQMLTEQRRVERVCPAAIFMNRLKMNRGYKE